MTLVRPVARRPDTAKMRKGCGVVAWAEFLPEAEGEAPEPLERIRCQPGSHFWNEIHVVEGL